MDTLQAMLPQVELPVLKQLLKRTRGDVTKAANLFYDDIDVSRTYVTRSKNSKGEEDSDSICIEESDLPMENSSSEDGYWVRGEDGEKKWVPTESGSSQHLEQIMTPPTKKKRKSGGLGIDDRSNSGKKVVGIKSSFGDQTDALWESAHHVLEGESAWRRDGGCNLLGRRARRSREYGKTEGFITAWRPCSAWLRGEVEGDASPRGPSARTSGDENAAGAASAKQIRTHEDANPRDGIAADPVESMEANPAEQREAGGADIPAGGGEGSACSSAPEAARGDAAADAASAGGGDGFAGTEWRLLYVDGDEEILTFEEATAAVRAAGPRSARRAVVRRPPPSPAALLSGSPFPQPPSPSQSSPTSAFLAPISSLPSVSQLPT